MNKNTDAIALGGEAVVAAHLQAAQEHFDNVLRSFEQKKSESDFTDDCLEQFAELAELFKRKNSQYGIKDQLANFRNGAMLARGNDSWSDMYETAKSYCLKHVAHVFGKTQTIDDDKLDESLRDIAVYSIIMLHMVKQHKAKQRKK